LHYRRRPGIDSAEEVLRELSRFHNEDGGFGRALESDYRSATSSVLATNIALSIVDRVAPSLEETGRFEIAKRDFVEPALEYLMSAYDRESSTWPIVSVDGEEEPHAPWWTAAKLKENFGGFLLNPSAECAAWLIRFGRDEARELGLSLVPLFLERIKRAASGSFPGEALECVRRLGAAKGLPGPDRAELESLLPAIVLSLVERDEAKWGDYCLRPYRAAPRPDSPAASELAPLVRRSLDWLLERQSPDGSFAPNWSWFGLFPETWPLAEKEWRGHIALEILAVFEAWGFDME
jgi:hypothetical protein